MLNEYQKRSVSISIRSLEKEIQDIERLLKGRGYAGILYRVENDVPGEMRDAVIAKITLIKERIKPLAEKFALEKKTEKSSWQIFGKLSSLWASLEETKAKRLKGYGAIREELESLLDPELDRIIELVSEMQSILEGRCVSKDKSGR